MGSLSSVTKKLEPKQDFEVGMLADNQKVAMKVIFEFLNYRDFLRELIQDTKAKGKSLRKLCEQCAIANPNFFQQVIEGKRNLSLASVRKISLGLDLGHYETEYLSALVRKEQSETANPDLTELNRLRHLANLTSIEDPSKHSSWLIGLIREMTLIQGCKLNVDYVSEKLGGLASKEDISQAIDFLIKRKLVDKVDGVDQFRRNNVRFAPLNDVRRVDLQRVHERYLNIARLRLSDDLKDREYQGYTVAIPASKFAKIKDKIRAFYDELELEMENLDPCENIIRIQTAAFHIIPPSKLSPQ